MASVCVLDIDESFVGLRSIEVIPNPVAHQVDLTILQVSGSRTSAPSLAPVDRCGSWREMSCVKR